MSEKKNKKIIIFASGDGTNAEQIIKYFKKNKSINVQYILTNKHDAGVLERAKKHEIPAFFYNNEAFEKKIVFELLISVNPDLIVLAGFIRKIPDTIISKYPKEKQNYSLRTTNYRYIKYSNGKEELYHDKKDPYEWHNVVFEKRYRK